MRRSKQPAGPVFWATASGLGTWGQPRMKQGLHGRHQAKMGGIGGGRFNDMAQKQRTRSRGGRRGERLDTRRVFDFA